MGFFSRNTAKKRIDWIDLTEIGQVATIKNVSKDIPVVILKHSTRCSISLMAKNRLDTTWDHADTNVTFYYLDLIRHRNISTEIAQEFGIVHESPQILVIKDGKCSYSVTHGNIDSRTIAKAL